MGSEKDDCLPGSVPTFELCQPCHLVYLHVGHIVSHHVHLQVGHHVQLQILGKSSDFLELVGKYSHVAELLGKYSHFLESHNILLVVREIFSN